MKNNSPLATLGALSQSKRLTLVEKLARAGSMPAGEIARMLRISPPNLSFHLRVLEEAGVLQSERQGRSIRYQVSFKPIDDLIAYLGSLPRTQASKAKGPAKSASKLAKAAKGAARARGGKK
jgi:DNA-binding transcriptional ArsR family regulator